MDSLCSLNTMKIRFLFCSIFSLLCCVSSFALAQQSASASDYYMRGLRDLDENKTDAALADFTKAVTLDPTLTQIYRYLGDILMGKGDLDGHCCQDSDIFE